MHPAKPRPKLIRVKGPTRHPIVVWVALGLAAWALLMLTAGVVVMILLLVLGGSS